MNLLIKSLQKAIQEEDKEKLLDLLAPNMGKGIEVESLPKNVKKKWYELEEKGIKILIT